MDLTTTQRKINLLKKNFDEIYFLAGQPSVKDSFNKITLTYESQILPLKNILDYIVKQNGKKTKFLYAGSSEIFGNVNKQKKINEDSFSIVSEGCAHGADSCRGQRADWLELKFVNEKYS